MAINFPASPTTGDKYVYNSKTWVWDGQSWINDTLGTLVYKGRKNYLINGSFYVCQRGLTQTSVSGYGSDDRWSNESVGHTRTHSILNFDVSQTDVPNFPYYFSRTQIHTVGGAAGDYVLKRQRIEHVRSTAGKTTTLSFYARTDGSQLIGIGIQQNFGNSGSTTESSNITTISCESSEWQKFTITFTWPSISGKSLGVNDYACVEFWFSSGQTYDYITGGIGLQSGIFDIAQVQLEDGDTATDFEVIHPAEELMLCERYYQKIDNTSLFGAGFKYTGAAISGLHGFEITFSTKRTTPIVSYTGYQLSNCTFHSILYTKNGLIVRITTSGAVHARIWDGIITIDAEL